MLKRCMYRIPYIFKYPCTQLCLQQTFKTGRRNFQIILLGQFFRSITRSFYEPSQYYNFIPIFSSFPFLFYILYYNFLCTALNLLLLQITYFYFPRCWLLFIVVKKFWFFFILISFFSIQ